MRKSVALILCLSLVLPSAALADADIQDIPPGDDKIVPMREGEKAPFSGQLFDPMTALRWSNWLLQYKLRLKADVEYEKRLHEADKTFWEKRLSIEEDKYKTVTLDYQKQVALRDAKIAKLEDEIRNPAWYRSVWFGVVCGVVVTGAAVGAGVYLGQ